MILMLGTSIAMIFGVEELTGRAYNIASDNYRASEMFTVVAGIYMVMTLHREPGARARRPLGVPRQGQGLLIDAVVDRPTREVLRTREHGAVLAGHRHDDLL